MIACIVISAGLAYYLALPFASLLQSAGYRIRALSRAKSSLISCAVYFALTLIAELLALFFAGKVLCVALTVLLYVGTAIFTYFTHRSMRMGYHFTRRLVRLLIAFVILYSGLVVGLYFLPLVALCAVTPTMAPFLLALTHFALSPFEKANNLRYIRNASARLICSSAVRIGITGSYGKTSVKHYLERLLSRRYVTLVTPENYNTPLGIAKTVETMSGKEEMLVLEMGARKRGDISELCEMTHPDIGVITGIAPQHLETFGSIDDVLREKNVLAQSVPADSAVFYNLTDALVRKLYDAREGKKIGVGYEDAEYLIKDVTFDAEGSYFTLSKGEDAVRISLPCVGKACVIDFALAAAVAIEWGVSRDDVSLTAKSCAAPSHRFEIVKKAPITVIDDSYNINPVGASVALDTLQAFGKGRKVVYTSGIVELGREEEKYNVALGRHIARVASLAIVCEGRYGDAVVRGMAGTGIPVLRVKDTKQASETFSRVLRQGDVLLIMSDLPREYLL